VHNLKNSLSAGWPVHDLTDREFVGELSSKRQSYLADDCCLVTDARPRRVRTHTAVSGSRWIRFSFVSKTKAQCESSPPFNWAFRNPLTYLCKVAFEAMTTDDSVSLKLSKNIRETQNNSGPKLARRFLRHRVDCKLCTTTALAVKKCGRKVYVA